MMSSFRFLFYQIEIVLFFSVCLDRAVSVLGFRFRSPISRKAAIPAQSFCRTHFTQ
jgi:hypothetical protein